MDKFNLLYDIINPPKQAKYLYNNYSPILHECMKTKKVRAKFNNFQILLDSRFSSTILIRRLVEKYSLKKVL